MLNWNLSDKEWQSWNQSKIQLKFVLFAQSLFSSLRWNICIDVTFRGENIKIVNDHSAIFDGKVSTTFELSLKYMFSNYGEFYYFGRAIIITWFNFILLIPHLQLYYVYFVKLEYYLKVHMTRKISREYLWNKNRYHKKKNAILLYFEKPFKLAYFWNDLFFGSRAL